MASFRAGTSAVQSHQTRRLIEQVKRDIDRFPSDFMFQLTKDEATALRSQSGWVCLKTRTPQANAPCLVDAQTRGWTPRAHRL